MMNAFQQRRWPLVILWVLIIAAIVAAPSVLPVFRLNLLGRFCLLYTSPSPRDATLSRMPSSA